MFITVIVFTLMVPFMGISQEEREYDETSILLTVPRIGYEEIPAVIYKQEAYLSIKDLFNYLRIKNTVSSNLDSIAGFVVNPKNTFLIDQPHNRILFQDKIIELKQTDLIRTGTGLYLRSNYFGEVFDLACSFNFRNLSINLVPKLELPAIREMNQELMRRNINQLKGEKKADTTVKRKFSMLRLGMVDWAVSAMQQRKGINEIRANVAIGATVAGGEANLYLNYSGNHDYSSLQQYFRWRYVNNDHAALRQVILGRIATQSTSTIYAPVTGLQLTNTPSTYRRSFGTYRISNTTEPGWTVELYVNNVLVNYVKADASGFYSFDVPMFYGNSLIRLRFYGPWGEEITREQNVSIPFTFIPLHNFEYTLTAGILDNEQKDRYSRANFNYGLSRRITIGGGVEYLSSVSKTNPMPFMNASVRLGNSIVLSGEHTYGVRSKGLMNYRMASGLQVELNYIKYANGQTAIKKNYLEERTVSLSFPFRSKKLAAFSRFSYNQYKLVKSKYSNAEFLLSASSHGISSNLTTSATYTNPSSPFIYSNLSFTFHLPGRIRFTPQIQYGYKQQKPTKIKSEVEKVFSTKGALSVTYERNPVINTHFIGINLRLNFSSASTSFSASRTGKITTFIQSLSGSLIHDGKTNYIDARSYNSVGKGGLTIIPFLDLNCNGKRDKNERNIPGLKFRINGGRIVVDEDKIITRVLDLEAYTSYFIELDPSGFDNIAWQIKNKTIKIVTEPNQMKMVEVPVAVVGEVSGTVNIKTLKGTEGLGRMIINVYNRDSLLVGRTLSEEDGYFSYLGLAPGLYVLKMDADQLHKLNMVASPASVTFTIRSSEDGDIADGFEFNLLQINNTLKK